MFSQLEDVIALADRRAREQGLRWTFDDEYIRSTDGRCPLEVAGDVDQGEYEAAAAALVLLRDEKWTVVIAADRCDNPLPHQLALRHLMLTTFDFTVTEEAKES